MWRAAGGRLRLAHVTRDEWAGSSELRHAASVQSRTIMKNPPSAEAAADTHDSHRRHRASHPRLPEQHLADRWLEDPNQLFLSLNAEENGTARSLCALLVLYAWRMWQKLRLSAFLWRVCACRGFARWNARRAVFSPPVSVLTSAQRSVAELDRLWVRCVALRWARPGNSRGFGSCLSRC